VCLLHQPGAGCNETKQLPAAWQDLVHTYHLLVASTGGADSYLHGVCSGSDVPCLWHALAWPWLWLQHWCISRPGSPSLAYYCFCRGGRYCGWRGMHGGQRYTGLMCQHSKQTQRASACPRSVGRERQAVEGGSEKELAGICHLADLFWQGDRGMVPGEHTCAEQQHGGVGLWLAIRGRRSPPRRYGHLVV
jgi:hypothetical protein